MNLNENSLYSGQAEKDVFLKDKESIANAFFVNTIGLIALYSIPEGAAKVRVHLKPVSVRISNVDDASIDSLLALKLYADIGGIGQTRVDSITKLFALMKGTIVLDEKKVIDDIFKGILINSHRPSAKVKEIFDELIEGKIKLPQYLEKIYLLAKMSPLLGSLSTEFFRLTDPIRSAISAIPPTPAPAVAAPVAHSPVAHASQAAQPSTSSTAGMTFPPLHTIPHPTGAGGALQMSAAQRKALDDEIARISGIKNKNDRDNAIVQLLADTFGNEVRVKTIVDTFSLNAYFAAKKLTPKYKHGWIDLSKFHANTPKNGTSITAPAAAPVSAPVAAPAAITAPVAAKVVQHVAPPAPVVPVAPPAPVYDVDVFVKAKAYYEFQEAMRKNGLPVVGLSYLSSYKYPADFPFSELAKKLVDGLPETTEAMLFSATLAQPTNEISDLFAESVAKKIKSGDIKGASEFIRSIAYKISSLTVQKSRVFGATAPETICLAFSDYFTSNIPTSDDFRNLRAFIDNYNLLSNSVSYYFADIVERKSLKRLELIFALMYSIFPGMSTALKALQGRFYNVGNAYYFTQANLDKFKPEEQEIIKNCPFVNVRTGDLYLSAVTTAFSGLVIGAGAGVDFKKYDEEITIAGGNDYGSVKKAAKKYLETLTTGEKFTLPPNLYSWSQQSSRDFFNALAEPEIIDLFLSRVKIDPIPHVTNVIENTRVLPTFFQSVKSYVDFLVSQDSDFPKKYLDFFKNVATLSTRYYYWELDDTDDIVQKLHNEIFPRASADETKKILIAFSVKKRRLSDVYFTRFGFTVEPTDLAEMINSMEIKPSLRFEAPITEKYPSLLAVNAMMKLVQQTIEANPAYFRNSSYLVIEMARAANALPSVPETIKQYVEEIAKKYLAAQDAWDSGFFRFEDFQLPVSKWLRDIYLEIIQTSVSHKASDYAKMALLDIANGKYGKDQEMFGIVTKIATKGVSGIYGTQSIIDIMSRDTMVDFHTPDSLKYVAEMFEKNIDMSSNKKEQITVRDSYANFVTFLNKDKPDIAGNAFDGLDIKTRRAIARRIVKMYRTIGSVANLSDPSFPIRPYTPISSSGMQELIKKNKIDQITADVNLPLSDKRLASLKVFKSELSTIPKAEFPKLAVTELQKDKAYFDRKTVELDAFSARKHGDIAVRILREFDVNLPGNKAAFDKFVAANPQTGYIEPAFHGTSSIAASFILRTGFVVITSSSVVSIAGKALGDGIYFSNKIDKATQYIGDSRGSQVNRRWGTRGYLLQMKAALGTRGRDFESAGTGSPGDKYGFVSPEWAVKQPLGQLLIQKAYEVELVSMKTVSDLAKTIDLNEGVKQIKTFTMFLEQARARNPETIYRNVTTFTFMDNQIPIGNGQFVTWQDFKIDEYGDHVALDMSEYGPVVMFYHNRGEDQQFLCYTAQELSDDGKMELYMGLLRNQQIQ